MTAQQIIKICQNELAKPANKHACNLFVRAVDTDLGFSDFSANDLADAMIAKLEKSPSWRKLANGVAAAQAAAMGKFVIGGLKSGDFQKNSGHGHIVVVVSGLIAKGAYPMAYWGNLGGQPSHPTGQTVNWAFLKVDVNKVEYFARN